MGGNLGFLPFSYVWGLNVRAAKLSGDGAPSALSPVAPQCAVQGQP